MKIVSSIRKRSSMLWWGTFLLPLVGIPSLSQAEVFEGYPDVVVCEFTAGELGAAGHLVYYVHAKYADGHLEYMPLVNAARLKVTKSGIVEVPRVDDCHGKHIDVLKAEGKARSFGTLIDKD